MRKVLQNPPARNENSAKSFSDRSFWKSLRVVDVRAFGSCMSAPKCLFFHGLEGPDRSFAPRCPQRPPDVLTCRTPEVLQNSGVVLGAQACILRTGFPSSLVENEEPEQGDRDPELLKQGVAFRGP